MSEQEKNSQEQLREVVGEATPIERLDANLEAGEIQEVVVGEKGSSEKNISKTKELGQELNGKGKSKKKRIFLTLLFTSLILLVSGGVYLFNHYSAGDIRGSWRSRQIEDSIKRAYEISGEDSGLLSSDSKFLVGRKVVVKVTEDRIKGTAILTFDKEAYYKAYEENISDFKERLSAYASRASQLNPENNIFEMMDETFTVSREDALKGFDEDIKEVLPKGAKYDAETGQVTIPVFSGKINQMEHTLKLSSVTKSKGFGLGELPLKKGAKLEFVKTKNGVRITDSKKKDKLVLNK